MLLEVEEVHSGLRFPGNDVSAYPDFHPLAGRGLVVKRSLDVILAAVAIVLLAPIVLLTLVAVRLESPGPVLFRQQRVGRNHRLFWMYKIRSMYSNIDHSEHQAYVAKLINGEATTHDGVFKLTRDERVTRVGRFIRKYSLDEVPQLWNVLKGEMSLVGPRPALSHEVALYNETARQRLTVLPGMTGLWQVSGRCSLSFTEMIELDLAYTRDWAPHRDLAILARTPIAAFTGRGAA